MSGKEVKDTCEAKAENARDCCCTQSAEDRASEAAKCRVVNELAELNGRMDKLAKFITTKDFAKLSDMQRVLLVAQIREMHSTSTILQLRLSNW